MNRMYIRDDQHELWFLEDGRIRMDMAEYDEDGNIDPENGYPANDWNEAVQLLNQYGYISLEGDEDDG